MEEEKSMSNQERDIQREAGGQELQPAHDDFTPSHLPSQHVFRTYQAYAHKEAIILEDAMSRNTTAMSWSLRKKKPCGRVADCRRPGAPRASLRALKGPRSKHTSYSISSSII